MKNKRLSKSERIIIFLNEYYLGYGIYYSIIRIVGGPLILIMGLNLYLNGNSKLGIGNSGFMILFGIYYLAKPLILILTQKGWFNNFDLNYEIESEKIIIQSEKSKSEIYYSELKTVLRRRTYFALKTKSNHRIYLPITNLESNEYQILEKLIKTSANKKLS